MTAPMTFNQFLRHCRRFVDKEIRARVTLPGSQHFSPDEMEAEHRTRRSPDGKDIFAVGLGGKIVESTDRGRRPLLILGLDQSITRTGFALYEYPGEERHMRCGSFVSATNSPPCLC
ncbi:hypothetical protein GOL25_32595 [Sinorhizobium medicae]|nr:hypothetical protein [Sinorhizobium medicae]